MKKQEFVMASKRILKELKDLQKDPPTSCSAGTITSNYWNCGSVDDKSFQTFTDLHNPLGTGHAILPVSYCQSLHAQFFFPNAFPSLLMNCKFHFYNVQALLVRTCFIGKQQLWDRQTVPMLVVCS